MKKGLNRKDEMFNMLVYEFQKKNLSFPKSVADSDGSYFIMVIAIRYFIIQNKRG